MKKKVDEIRGLHSEIEDLLDEKLRALDRCMEEKKECPCGEGNCEIDPEKFQKMGSLYDELFTDKDFERIFKELQKSVEADEDREEIKKFL